jgi:hypothetical protein
LKAIITTSETGYLAKLRTFEDTVREQQYVVQPTDDDINFFGDLLPDHVEATITTDGGGESSKSHDLTGFLLLADFELRATVVCTSKKHALNTFKMAPLLISDLMLS